MPPPLLQDVVLLLLLLLLAALVAVSRAGRADYPSVLPVRCCESTGGDAVEAGGPLLPSVVQQWRDEGVAVVDDLLPADVIARARAAAVDRFPEAMVLDDRADFGSNGEMEFPTAYPALNEVVLHPRLLAAVSQLLGCSLSDIRLSQADVWAKVGPTRGEFDARGPLSNFEQRFHVDYPNHYLTLPAEWDRPHAVALIIFYDGTRECGGATGAVRRRGEDDPLYKWPNALTNTPGFGAIPWINDAEAAEAYLREHFPDVAAFREALYEREERVVTERPGSVLLYRLDAWHRGTRVHEGKVRRVHNLVFKHTDAEFITTWNPGWATKAYSRSMSFEKTIAGASVAQRTVLGFPPPGHAYWTPRTLEGVRLRFGPLGIDMSPYEQDHLTSTDGVGKACSGSGECDELE